MSGGVTCCHSNIRYAAIPTEGPTESVEGEELQCQSSGSRWRLRLLFPAHSWRETTALSELKLQKH